eukprot:6224608-Pyramimonas_sp.AAC.1
MESKAEGRFEACTEQAMTALEGVLAQHRLDRDSERTESQLTQAIYTKLYQAAQQQLEQHIAYIEKQQQSLDDLEVKRALLIADVEAANITKTDMELK